ncbi:hypothetical protein SKAU_G00030170 [Synaphobranchus kaupii]|uniref:Uncharacterized protein n=1 Tax=Synaphobranchus kaupii TaxID=118154 RepID=A0A9Q1GEW4_SYNKA|nr:hypothetical protein SKAU_G00030170 [Synaphobranchus kaupii]
MDSYLTDHLEQCCPFLFSPLAGIDGALQRTAELERGAKGTTTGCARDSLAYVAIGGVRLDDRTEDTL